MACFIAEVSWLGRELVHVYFPGAPDSPRSTFASSSQDLDASYCRGLVAEEEKAAVVVRGSNMAETLAIT